MNQTLTLSIPYQVYPILPAIPTTIYVMSNLSQSQINLPGSPQHCCHPPYGQPAKIPCNTIVVFKLKTNNYAQEIKKVILDQT